MHEYFLDLVAETVDKVEGLEPAEREPYENRIWFFVKNLVGFLANLVTAAPASSQICEEVLRAFTKKTVIIEFITKLSESEEESKEEQPEAES